MPDSDTIALKYITTYNSYTESELKSNPLLKVFVFKGSPSTHADYAHF